MDSYQVLNDEQKKDYRQLMHNFMNTVVFVHQLCAPFIVYKDDSTNDYQNTNHFERAEFFLMPNDGKEHLQTSMIYPKVTHFYKGQLTYNIWSFEQKPQYSFYLLPILDSKPFIKDSISNQKINFIEIQMVGDLYSLESLTKSVSVWYELETKKNYSICYDSIDDRVYISKVSPAHDWMTDKQAMDIFTTLEDIFSKV